MNCFAECLSEIKHLSQAADDFVNILTICSNEKIADFFSEIKKIWEKKKKEQKQWKLSKNRTKNPKKAQKMLTYQQKM